MEKSIRILNLMLDGKERTMTEIAKELSVEPRSMSFTCKLFQYSGLFIRNGKKYKMILDKDSQTNFCKIFNGFEERKELYDKLRGN